MLSRWAAARRTLLGLWSGLIFSYWPHPSLLPIWDSPRFTSLVFPGSFLFFSSVTELSARQTAAVNYARLFQLSGRFTPHEKALEKQGVE